MTIVRRQLFQIFMVWLGGVVTGAAMAMAVMILVK